ncbi:beta-lactamase family protein [Nocardia abscessus]|uniref:serine hydrolase domain-containing protein n=1 Tax=Nocardia abscessus TaxID=120957 RepID=UPI0018958668|nr:serine hydrolase domain-containing protein [Nocardia abscessus]MBF6335104.1 beta-lactamase family protein [Nocardia abscessus]
MSVVVSPWGEFKPEYGYACAEYGPGGAEQASADGLANLAGSERFTLQTRVNCGSIAKLVTAHFVTRLWSSRDEREQLRIGTLLPGVPSPLRDVTVERCLTHTTGLWDFRSLIPLFGERSTFAYGVSDAFELAIKQTHLVPGFERQYSNTNYLLLGVAVERETGALLQDLVVDWLGSDVGNFVTNPRAVVPARARGYEVGANEDVLEFGSFVDGRGSTNFWANTQELATLIERVTNGFETRPVYGGLALSSDTFYVAGQDGGFRAAAVIDANNRRCHVALTNDPALTPLDIMATHTGLRVQGTETTSRAREHVSGDRTEFEGTFASASLGVQLSLAGAPDGALVVSVGDRVLGKLERETSGSFSDGHLEIVERNDTIYLSINHARGIPLDRVFP